MLADLLGFTLLYRALRRSNVAYQTVTGLLLVRLNINDSKLYQLGGGRNRESRLMR